MLFLIFIKIIKSKTYEIINFQDIYYADLSGINICTGKAEVKLPAIFSDNMVIQQQTEAAIWGTATANSTVRLQLHGTKDPIQRKQEATENGKLRSAHQQQALFNYHKPGKTIVLKNVLIGRVWVCSVSQTWRCL